MVVLKFDDIEYYMDGHLNTQLGAVRAAVQDDDDFVFLFTGDEGAGKSVFAFQVAKKLDPNFDINSVVFTPKSFESAVLKGRRYQAIVYDEAYSGLSSRASLSQINRQLVNLMTQMRQLNLFVIVVLPTIWLLDWYAAVHRSRGLFYVYRRKGKRGYWVYYNKKRKNALYELPRHLRGNHSIKPNFFGRFTNRYAVNEKEYRDKKEEALRSDFVNEQVPKYLEQRNALLEIMNKELGISLAQIEKHLKGRGVQLKKSALGSAIESSLKKKKGEA